MIHLSDVCACMQKALTGMDDLTKVKCLQLKVDTTETSLGNFGTFLPNLQELKIKDGIVPSIRDLGSSLSNVQILWMPRCSLQELDGITTLENLAELFIAYNDVAELSPLSMLEHLRLLDIEGNNVDDLKQVEYLAFCPKLTTLTLDGNPVATNEKRAHGQVSSMLL
jgi:Leucine-rich repeat (LRR) protein